MGLPTKKLCSSRGKVRRAAFKLKIGNVSICPKCQKPVRPHHACAKCGTYKNREVIKIKFKHLKKKEKEAKAKK
jgi:large subunit ribosomal protein L32